MPWVYSNNTADSLADGSVFDWSDDYPAGAELQHWDVGQVGALSNVIPDDAQINQVDLTYSLTYSSNHTTTDRAHGLGIGLYSPLTFTGDPLATSPFLSSLVLHDQIATAPASYSGTVHFTPGVGDGPHILEDGTIPSNWNARPYVAYHFDGVDVGPFDGVGATYHHACEIAVLSASFTVFYSWRDLVDYSVTGALVESRRLFKR